MENSSGADVPEALERVGGKMPLGPQFAQGLGRGINAELSNRASVYSPARCLGWISRKLFEILKWLEQHPLTMVQSLSGSHKKFEGWI